MVNHTLNNIDDVATYGFGANLLGYLADVSAGAQFLENAGLNSAPNWFIYPHGDTNNNLKLVIGSLYKFARTTQSEPETYPFGDPLAVKTLEIHSVGDIGGLSTVPAEVLQALEDTKRFGNTLILTFHRIHAVASDPHGYPLQDFETIANDLKFLGMPVMTLSGLDYSNGIPEDNHIRVVPARSSQTVVSLKVQRVVSSSNSIWSTLTGWL
jgi:hypothetical protein